MALISPLNNENSEPVIAPKRGRPAKNAAVYDTDGNLFISEERHEELNELAARISHSVEKVEAILRNSAYDYFRIGEILQEALNNAVGPVTWSDIAGKLGIPEKMLKTGKKVYKEFANNPEALGGMNLRDVTLLIAEKKAKEEESEENMVKYALPKDQQGPLSEEQIARKFALPTLSGVQLKRHRMHFDRQNGLLYVLAAGVSHAVSVCSLTAELPKTPDMELAYTAMEDKVQTVIEEYYSLIEESEDAGN